MAPKVTMLMGVYNGERTIREAIDSVLEQTYKDFELLIINDGSKDKSVEIIESIKDPRIRLVHNEKNMNLVPTFNRGLELAQGEYIARMDADDKCVPERLEKQVSFMDTHPGIGICGSWIKYFEGADAIVKLPENHDEIMCRLFFSNVIAHPTVIMRKKVLKENNLKYEMNLAEDYDLWQRASFKTKLHNIQEVLLNYRISKESYSQLNSPKVSPVINEMIKRNLKPLKIEADEELSQLHKDIGNSVVMETKEKAQKAMNHLKALYNSNKKINIYPNRMFNVVLSGFIFDVLDRSPFSKKEKLISLWSSPLVWVDIKRSMKYTLRILKNTFLKR